MNLGFSTDEYIVNYHLRSPIFKDLESIFVTSKINDWPTVDQLQSLLPKDLCAKSGKKLQFYPQNETLPEFNMGYEERIYQTGLISTREKNWHDYFNALIWTLFPKTKIELNVLHFQEITSNNYVNQNNKRTYSRDAITHLDESGIIIAVSDWKLVELLRAHQWKEVFYDLKDFFKLTLVLVTHNISITKNFSKCYEMASGKLNQL